MSIMAVSGIDHIALPTANAERLLAFYEKLGFGTENVEDWRAGRLLRSNGAELSELATHHATLEDVFISLTGRHLRDE